MLLGAVADYLQAVEALAKSIEGNLTLQVL